MKRKSPSTQGRSELSAHKERRFIREMDSYYGRGSRSQYPRERSFRGDDHFRPTGREEPGPWPQNSRQPNDRDEIRREKLSRGESRGDQGSAP